MATRSPQSTSIQPPLALDPVSTWRAWQTLEIYFTVLLNRQLRRRWLLEHKSMQDRPVSQRFRPVLHLEPVPTLHKPRLLPADTNDPHNPFNKLVLETLKTKVELLRARVEKGKELAAEIERRMVKPHVTFPTHFCHTCVADGETGGVEVLLTKCGHRVCQTCLSFGMGSDGVYECSICFAPADLVARSPLSAQRSCSEKITRVSKKSLVAGGKGRKGPKALASPLVESK
ncbi:uncharacterized protein N7482_005717 [Penicillium canariense]|uniref:RING-type domain-containing protein n=1 Tax=Penicillium canariense TaxID=189055 RepID=A0A9W9I4H1_9EURO|nr:uncharacterized protein N7482_005717 [Penicillium canariense]KAJ5166936.1 hypothetical protein N7482_005717 [Penicillium canariense]